MKTLLIGRSPLCRSFHALAIDGTVLHWGTLNGDSFAPFVPANSPVHPLAHPGRAAPTPTLLRAEIPPMQRMVCGRSHVVALDSQGNVWTWANWAEAAQLSAEWLGLHSESTARSIIADIAAGWNLSAVLMTASPGGIGRSGGAGRSQARHREDVYIWFRQFASPSLLSYIGHPTNATPIAGRRACFTWQPQALCLPPIPIAVSDEGIKTASLSSEQYPTISKISAGDNFVLALTNTGDVYKIDVTPPMRRPAAFDDPDAGPDAEGRDDGSPSVRQLADLEDLFLTGRRTWRHLPTFSQYSSREQELGELRGTGRDATPTGYNSSKEKQRPAAITHISSNFQTFFCIGPGVVLQGNKDADETTLPLKKPELQNADVIRVECGDYHYGALTSTGRLFTFGQFSNGALGHGPNNSRLTNPLLSSPTGAVEVPSMVHFHNLLDDPEGTVNADDVESEYCFNIALAGWASGALTVSLHDNVRQPRQTEEIMSEGKVCFGVCSRLQISRLHRMLGKDSHSASLPRPASGAASEMPFSMGSDDGWIPPLPVLHRPLLPDGTEPLTNPRGRGFRFPIRIGYPARGMFRGGAGQGRGATTHDQAED